ncbi:MAG: hypothetical protein M2R45_04986 [Verrucomicrobia subdivision 3 bacterium]|nr:hypothetical protein [Limisphaerales bacterium]MCS1415583.1 hypothetical protein [Limisphaerales bacterium]
MEIELTTHFKEFLTLMIRHRVAFMIIGGFAVNFHGFPKLTHDIDLLVQPEVGNYERLRGALLDFGFPQNSLQGSPVYQDKNNS